MIYSMPVPNECCYWIVFPIGFPKQLSKVLIVFTEISKLITFAMYVKHILDIIDVCLLSKNQRKLFDLTC